MVITHAASDHTELDRPPFTEGGGVDGFLHAFGDDRAGTLLIDLNENFT